MVGLEHCDLVAAFACYAGWPRRLQMLAGMSGGDMKLLPLRAYVG